MKNEPAFPRTGEENIESWQLGMTLRDYFAAKAMQGALSGIWAQFTDGSNVPSDDKLAERCYEYADAMLAKRGEGEKWLKN